MSELYTAPPNLVEVRERLFTAAEIQVLTVTDFKATDRTSEICDSLFQRYYRLEEAAAELPEPARDSLFARWITCLGKVTGPIRSMAVMELLGNLPELPLKWIEATDSQLRAEGATESHVEERRREMAGFGDDSELEG